MPASASPAREPGRALAEFPMGSFSACSPPGSGTAHTVTTPRETQTHSRAVPSRGRWSPSRRESSGHIPVVGTGQQSLNGCLSSWYFYLFHPVICFDSLILARLIAQEDLSLFSMDRISVMVVLLLYVTLLPLSTSNSACGPCLVQARTPGRLGGLGLGCLLTGLPCPELS